MDASDCKHDWRTEDTSHRVCRLCGATEWIDDRYKLHYTTADGIPILCPEYDEKAVRWVEKELEKMRKK